MNMYRLIKSVLLIYVGIMFGGCFQDGTRNKVNIKPYLTNLTPTSVSIKWNTLNDEKGCVNVLINGGWKEFCEPSASRTHEVNIKGLKSDTSYEYNVETVLEASPGIFKTMPINESGEDVIWILGDPGYDNISLRSNISAMESYLDTNNLELTTIATTGDNAYSSGTMSEYRDGFFTPLYNYLKDYSVWPVMGNHDNRSDNFYPIFDFPVNGENGGYPSGKEDGFIEHI